MKNNIIASRTKKANKEEALEILSKTGVLDTKDQAIADMSQGEVITAIRQHRERKAGRSRGRSR